MRSALARALLLALWFAPARSQQHTAAAARGSVFVTPEMGLHGRTPEAALSEPFPEAYQVTVGAGAQGDKRSLTNCQDVLSLGDTKRTAGSTPDNNSLHATEARCYALDWLRNAKSSPRLPAAGFSLRALQVRQLPPELALVISDDEIAGVQEASRHGKSLLAIDPEAKLLSLSTVKAKLMTDDWTALLTLYASGDFTGNGREQVLLRWDASATGGTYTLTKLFLLERGPHGFTVLRQR